MEPNLILLAHLPFLRMERSEDFAFGPGCLTKLPWQQYDDITQGAFSDWKPKYLETDPVFYWVQDAVGPPLVEPDPNGVAAGFLESKVPREGWHMLPQMGLGVLLEFQLRMVRPVWAALALAAPHARIVSPMNSVAFQLAAGAHCLDFQGKKHQGARVQGEADQELVYLADGAASPLRDDELERARELLPLAAAALAHRDTENALNKLLSTFELTLHGPDRLLLAVTALEELLLPEVTSGMGRVFSRRLAHLLGADDAHRAQLLETALMLYRLRSMTIHVEQKERQLPDMRSAAAIAEQLLAEAVEVTTATLADGTSVEALRESLDEKPASEPSNLVRRRSGSAAATPARPSEVSDASRGRSRLGPRKSWGAGTFSTAGSLKPPEGHIVSWSPLVGCRLDSLGFSHDGLGFSLAELPLAAVVDMEEKDIRRDFISSVRVGESLPVIAVFGEKKEGWVTEDAVTPLARVRDLAVVGLRLASRRAVIDPELLGWYVYEGSMRFRRETVLRQSVLMAARKDAIDAVDGDDQELVDSWNLVAAYQRCELDARVEDCLAMFRRAHDRRFLAAGTRASLLLGNLENLLGRFRPRKKKTQLEDLVARLPDMPSETAEWFAKEGRVFRNQIAHRNWDPPAIPASSKGELDQPELDHLLEINRLAITALLREWVRVDPPVRKYRGPSRLLLRTLK